MKGKDVGIFKQYFTNTLSKIFQFSPRSFTVGCKSKIVKKIKYLKHKNLRLDKIGQVSSLLSFDWMSRILLLRSDEKFRHFTFMTG